MSAIPIVKGLGSANDAVNITDANATHSKPKGVYVGVGDDYEFSFDGTTWVRFENTADGSVLPIRPVGARHASDSSAPNANDITFLY